MSCGELFSSKCPEPVRGPHCEGCPGAELNQSTPRCLSCSPSKTGIILKTSTLLHVNSCSGQASCTKNANIHWACFHVRNSRNDPVLLIKNKGTQALIGRFVVVCAWHNNSFVVSVVGQHRQGEQRMAFLEGGNVYG